MPFQDLVTLQSNPLFGSELVLRNDKEGSEIKLGARGATQEEYSPYAPHSGLFMTSHVYDSIGLGFYEKNAKPKMELHKIGEGGIEAAVAEEGPSLKVSDKKGSAILGAVRLETKRTGIVNERPASSLVLFNQKGNVIWQAPR